MSSKLRILHVINSFEFGGAEAMLCNLILRTDRTRFEPMVAALIDESANLIQRLNVFGMLAEGKFNFGLLDDRIDAAHPIGLRVGQQFEAVEGVVEIIHCLAVSPAAL